MSMHSLFQQLSQSAHTLVDDLQYTVSTLDAITNEPISDVYGQRSDSDKSRINDPQTITGTARLIFPFMNFARVVGDHGRGDVHCSFENFVRVPDHGEGYNVLSTLDEGIGSLLQRRAEPRVFSDSFWSDVVVSGSAAGLYAQQIYKKLLTDTDDRYGARDFCSGQPYDQLPGDWGFIHPSGVGIHSDELMAFLRASETCGIYAFYADNTLRIAGEGLQIESDTCNITFGNDVDELYAETFHYYNTCEIFGYFVPGQTRSFVSKDPAEIVRDGGFVYKSEEYVAFPRFREYGGYLGQGQLVVLAAPPKETVPQLTEAIADTLPALAKTYIGVGGHVVIESAKRITIAKTSLGYLPRRKLHADSTAENSDNKSNYKFSGYFGDGDEHVIRDVRYEHSDSTVNGFASVVGVYDMYALDSCWAPLHVFAAHKNDFEISKPELPTTSFDTSSLADSDEILPPPAQEWQIDHRMKEKLYQLLSLIQIGEDGAIIIQEAMGGSITLSKGVVDISGTSVRLNGGKAIHATGGRFIVRTAKDIDLVSTESRVRLSAAKDLMMLGGSKGSTGGVLIESRGAGTNQRFPEEPDDISISGIVLKSGSAPVATISAGFYVRTGIEGSDVNTGPIVLDAAGGQNNLILRGSDIASYCSGQVMHLFGVRPEYVRKANLYGENYNRFNGSIGTLQQVIVGGGVQAVGYIVSAADVGRAQFPELVRQAVNSLQQQMNETISSAREKLQVVVKEGFEGNEKVGNIDTASRISFGFPSSDSYSAGRVRFVQPHWQKVVQYADSGRMRTWSESAVMYQPKRANKPTYAWPGNDAMTDTDGWVTSEDDKVYSQAQQSPLHPRDSKEAYVTMQQSENPKLITGQISKNLAYIP